MLYSSDKIEQVSRSIKGQMSEDLKMWFYSLVFEEAMSIASGELNRRLFDIYKAAISFSSDGVEYKGGELNIEEGHESLDMKKWLLKNAETSKDGNRYKIIPIQYTKTGSDSTQKLPSTIYKKLLKLEEGQKLNIDTGKYVNSYYKGITKTSSEKEGKSNYIRFTAVSEKSDGWKYPAKEGKHFILEALKRVENEVDFEMLELEHT